MGESTNNKTQQTRIVEYCKSHRGITSLDAVRDLGIIRLASRINDLKRNGFKVESDWETVQNRYGEDTRVKRYYVEEKEAEKTA